MSGVSDAIIIDSQQGSAVVVCRKYVKFVQRLEEVLGVVLTNLVLKLPLENALGKPFKNIARIAKRCPSNIASVVNVSSCFY